MGEMLKANFKPHTLTKKTIQGKLNFPKREIETTNKTPHLQNN